MQSVLTLSCPIGPIASSPWQLQPEIEAFTAAAGFPPATFHMKTVRLTSLPGSGRSLLNVSIA